MAISGFPIISEVIGMFQPNQPWFSDGANVGFNGVTDESGDASFIVPDPSLFEIGDIVIAFSFNNALYPSTTGEVTAITATSVTTDITFVATSEDTRGNLQTRTTTFSAVIDDGDGDTNITVPDSSIFQVGDYIYINGDPNYPNQGGAILDIPNGTTLHTTIPFNGNTDTGFIQLAANIIWNNNKPSDPNYSGGTPENIAREIHVQFDTSTPLIIGIALNGVDHMNINNGDDVDGIVTLTFFVKTDTQLNFTINSDGVNQVIAATVFSAR